MHNHLVVAAAKLRIYGRLGKKNATEMPFLLINF